MHFKSSVCFLFGLAVLAAPQPSQAQGAGLAFTEARARLICGTGTVVSAQHLPGGLLEVTCRKNVPHDSLPKEMQGTGLTASAEAVAVAAAAAFAVVVGSSSSTTTSAPTD